MRFALVIIENDRSRRSIHTDRSAHRAALEAWMRQHGEAGTLVGGEAFETERTTPVTIRRAQDGSSEVTDGPFAGKEETLGGYVLVEAPDMDAAVAVAKTWPASGETIEIRPIWEP